MRRKTVKSFSASKSPQSNPLAAAINLEEQGKMAEAEAQYRQILRASPTDVGALYSLSGLLINSGRYEEALRYATLGVKVNKKFSKIYHARGRAFMGLNRFDEALASYNQALRLTPNAAELLLDIGTVLKALGHFDAALERFQQVLEIDQENEIALKNSGVMFSIVNKLKGSPQAVAAFKRLFKKNENAKFGLGMLNFELMKLCDWTDIEELTQKAIIGIREGRPVCTALSLMSLSDKVSDHFLCAKLHAKSEFSGRPTPLWRGERYSHARTRIAYVSADFREHPVSHLLAGVIEAHDKSRFETVAISLVAGNESPLRARITAAFDHFIQVQGMHPRKIAEIMRQMEVDIAVDLGGYTSESDTEIFLNRPAPIQVNYLGYPGTLGLESHDYIIADRTVIPESHQAYYTEKVAYLDHCYLPIPSGVEVSEPLPRSAYELPEQAFVFCSFSADYKIHPQMFAVWMRLLDSIPGSVLWLVSRNEVSQKNLRQAAQRHKIDPDRLVFATRVSKIEDHLARYRVADLFLDTWPYNSHTTAADALLAGLPVVTYQGGAFFSRVAASLLKSFGLEQLVTNSFEEYFELARGLALDPARLQTFRDALSPAALRSNPLLGESFTRSLEKVFLSLTAPGLNGALIRQQSPAAATSRIAQTPETVQTENVATARHEDDPGLAHEMLRQANRPQPESPLLQSTARDGAASGLPNSAGLGNSPVLPDAGKKFLLINALGCRFWNEVHHLVSQMLLAELTQRIPIVLWEESCRFSNSHDSNAFGNFFQEVSPARRKDIPLSGTTYQAMWSFDNVPAEVADNSEGEDLRAAAHSFFVRAETVLVSGAFSTVRSVMPWICQGSRYYGLSEHALCAALFQRHIRPAAGLLAMADASFNRHMRGRPWVAVQVCEADVAHGAPHAANGNIVYFEFVDRIVELNPSIGIFLLAEPVIAEEFKARYGDRLVCAQSRHTPATRDAQVSGGAWAGEDALQDVLLALKCDYFVGTKNSNVSLAISSMRNWPQGFMFILENADSLSKSSLSSQQGQRVTAYTD